MNTALNELLASGFGTIVKDSPAKGLVCALLLFCMQLTFLGVGGLGGSFLFSAELGLSFFRGSPQIGGFAIGFLLKSLNNKYPKKGTPSYVQKGTNCPCRMLVAPRWDRPPAARSTAASTAGEPSRDFRLDVSERNGCLSLGKLIGWKEIQRDLNHIGVSFLGGLLQNGDF